MPTQDFNAAVDAEVDRVCRAFEKTEERLHEELSKRRVEIRDLKAEVARLEQRERVLEERLAATRRVMGDRGARGLPCPYCRQEFSFCERHGPYVRSDENQCPACRRGG